MRGLIAQIFHQGYGAGVAAPNSLSYSKGDGDDTPLCEVIELGREALRQKRSDEVAFDLLRITSIHWLDRIWGRGFESSDDARAKAASREFCFWHASALSAAAQSGPFISLKQNHPGCCRRAFTTHRYVSRRSCRASVS